MIDNFYVIDDFYSNPYEVREFALRQEYSEDFPGNFPGMRSRSIQDEATKRTKCFFEEFLGHKITFWNEGDSTHASFQLTLDHHKSWHHADQSEWAAVIYLTPNAPIESGTAIFRDKKTGIAWRDKDDERTHLPAYQTDWEEIISIGNLFNRCVLYRGNLYHTSRLNGFGDSVETGRLFQTFFFSTDGPERRPLTL